MIDITGSLLAIMVLSPVFFVIAVLIRLSSPGPIFFRQERLGRYGRRFTFLKFRSMFVASDAGMHQEYMKQFIIGEPASKRDANRAKVFKIVGDPRVTPIGRFLRRTSLDELPQFINVLLGEMSLVGPRPPIPYEFEHYDEWHKRRLLAVQPGITGLWQIAGRSTTTFDEMVRMDLRYAMSWSLWLDLHILLRTPGAVLSGNGAY